jgi:hypothetical protein
VLPLVSLEEGAELSLEVIDHWKEGAVEGAALEVGRFDLQSGIHPARLNFLAGIWLAVLISFIARLKKKELFQSDEVSLFKQKTYGLATDI